jgi:sugar/nucleoside kinase (ribokinase family)
MEYDFAVIGHIALDTVVLDQREREQLGGTPTYVSLGARMLGKRVKVVSKIGEDFPRKFRSTLAELGINIDEIRVEEAPTTNFRIEQKGDDRILRLENVCSSIQVRDLENLPETVLVSPIAGEVPTEVIPKIDAKTIALDPQGILREVQEDGSIVLKKRFENQILEGVTVFKSSTEELRIITGKNEPKIGLRKIIESGPEVAIATMGRRGALIATKEKRYAIPAFDVAKVVDTTGAGDVFIGGFLSAYVDGENPLWCSSLGSSMASFLVQTIGPEINASERQLISRAEEIYDKILEV